MTTIPPISNFDLTRLPVEGTPLFRANASYVWSTIPTVITQMGTAITAMNTVGEEIEAAKTASADSATASQASAEAASTSETNSFNSAEASQTSAEASAVARLAAEQLLDLFDDRNLGFKTNDPLVDNDGDALTTSAMYYNTVSKTWRSYDAELASWTDMSYTPTAHGSLSGTADNGAHPMSAITGLETEINNRYTKQEVDDAVATALASVQIEVSDADMMTY